MLFCVKEIALANGIDQAIAAQRIEDWAVLFSETAAHRAGPDAAESYGHALAIAASDKKSPP